MNVSILSISKNELIGKKDNKNLKEISSSFFKQNINVLSAITVLPLDDNIYEAFNYCFKTSDAIMVLTDEMYAAESKEAICKVIGDVLTDNTFARNSIIDYFKKNNLPQTKDSFKHSFLPSGAKAVANKLSSLCGFITEFNEKKIFFLPNNYLETKNMFENSILPYIVEETKKIYFSTIIKTFGISEKNMQLILEPVLKNKNKISIILSEDGLETNIVVRYSDKTSKVAVDEIISFIYEKLNKFIISDDEETLNSVAFNLLSIQNKKISFVEHGTNGAFTNEFLKYENQNRNLIESFVFSNSKDRNYNLKISDEVLASGEFSSDVAFEMTASILDKTNSDLAIAILCNFSDDLVYINHKSYIAIGDRENIDIFQNAFSGDKEEIIKSISKTAIYYLIKKLKQKDF